MTSLEPKLLKLQELRVPQGWSGFRYLPKAWTSIILELDAAIAELYPDYKVYQAKEKLDGLRYYCSVSQDEDVAILIQAAETKVHDTCM